MLQIQVTKMAIKPSYSLVQIPSLSYKLESFAISMKNISNARYLKPVIVSPFRAPRTFFSITHPHWLICLFAPVYPISQARNLGVASSFFPVSLYSTGHQTLPSKAAQTQLCLCTPQTLSYLRTLFSLGEQESHLTSQTSELPLSHAVVFKARLLESSSWKLVRNANSWALPQIYFWGWARQSVFE